MVWPVFFLSAQGSVQSLSHMQLFATPWTAARQASLSIHQFPEFTQTHVHWVSDTIQPSCPLLSPSPPAFNLSQHQGLFKSVSSSHQVGQSIGGSASASDLPMNTQDWSPLGWTGWISFQSKGLSRVFSNHNIYITLNIHICARTCVCVCVCSSVGKESPCGAEDLG